MHMLTRPQVFYDDTHKQAFGYQNPFYLKKALRIKPTLYDGHVITKKHDVICVADSEETLILAIDRRTKMMEKQNDPISKDKKVNISPINYAELNKLSEDFGKCFVPQNELSTEQVFWLSNLIFEQPVVQTTPVKTEAPCELPKVSLVKTSFQKLKNHLASFDKVVKVWTTTDAITEGAWAFEHTKEVFMKEVIQFLKSLKELFNEFDKELLISQDIVHTAVNSLAAINDYKFIEKSFIDEYNKTVELKAELAKKNEMVDKDVYNELSNRVSCSTEASESETKSNTKKNRITRTSRSNKKNNKVEDQPRIIKSSLNNMNHVSNTPCNANVKHFMLNVNSKLICATFNECMFDVIHDSCVHVYLNGVNARVESKSVKSIKSNKKKVWKSIGKIFTNVGYWWIPTGRTFTIAGNTCPLTRIISTKVVQIILWYMDSGCSKHMIGKRSQLINFVEKFMGTVRFGNDQIAKIMGYGDYQLGNVTISRVYYVEGLGHNLDINLYTISLDDMFKSSPICLLSKASKTKSWLWQLSHLNFGTLNQLAKQGLVRGLPKLKFKKDHLCSACSLGKSKKSSHKPKAEDTNQEKLYLLHMDLYRPMHLESINGKKCILVIVDDYSRFTWVMFLRSKDETPEAIIKCLKQI
ncbi:retrovirus-related pol polyprotein from transposon TNT 1-94 [Tanacetum coccineum]